MFAIKRTASGELVLSGRLDADSAASAREVMARITTSCQIDFSELDYISSAGLGVLVATQRRLVDSGQGLRLVGMSDHLRDLFEIAGLNNIFEIE